MAAYADAALSWPAGITAVLQRILNDPGGVLMVSVPGDKLLVGHVIGLVRLLSKKRGGPIPSLYLSAACVPSIVFRALILSP